MEDFSSECQKFYCQGNEALLDEQFEKAVEFYAKAIELEKCADFYVRRSQALFKLNRFKEVAEDIEQVEHFGPLNTKLLLRKGISLYNLGSFSEALNAFQQGHQTGGDEGNFSSWILKCEKKLKEEAKKKEKESTSQEVPVMPTLPKEKARYDWYQTDSHVIITVLIKNLKPEDIKTQHTESTFKFQASLPSDEDYNIDLKLSHSITPEKCTMKCFPSKVEIKLLKSESIRWDTLEYDAESTKRKVAKVSSKAVPEYPSSRPQKKDWDKIVVDIRKEEAEEKVEGEAALNELFQKIYSEGSDEVRKAMNKSFLESGGTVLSTNWKEVGSKPVDVKPPDGLEWKKWNQ